MSNKKPRFHVPDLEQVERTIQSRTAPRIIQPDRIQRTSQAEPQTQPPQPPHHQIPRQPPQRQTAPQPPTSSSTQNQPEAASRTSSAPQPSQARASGSAAASGHTVLVSPRQRGNPLLKHLRNVSWEYGPIVADFVMGQTTAALYLSLRYHLLHPDYIYARMSELKRSFNLRVIICHVDVQDSTECLMQVNTLASANDFTVMLVWSVEEAARYLETYKLFENKSAASIKEKVDSDYLSKVEDSMTVIRSVNRTDVTTLLRNFGSVRGIFNASVEEMMMCNGIGEKKIRFIHDALEMPFFADQAPPP